MAGSVPAELVALAQRLADAARPIANRYFRTADAVDDKTDASPVTIADREAETAMRALLTEHVPQHGVFGEEHGAVRTDAEYVWVLDPIDGTKSFIAGMPVWGSLIGLLHKGCPAYGIMVQPFTQERFTGDGRGALWRGPGCDHRMTERKLATRRCERLAQATLMTTSPLLYEAAKLKGFLRIEARARLSRYGGDCYAFA
ncbi:MAG: inositol monophosphatase family protein, partial [Burkholderiales bacterium]